MPEKPFAHGPGLASLLAERDDVRLRISAAHEPGSDPEQLAALRGQLISLDIRILKGWETPSV